MCVAPVRRREAMVTVTFVSSVQGYQEGRVAEIVKRLRTDHPEWKVDVLSPDASKPLLATYKLQFGPAILVNERIEFVGIPRYRMLVERIAMVAGGKSLPGPLSLRRPRRRRRVERRNRRRRRGRRRHQNRNRPRDSCFDVQGGAFHWRIGLVAKTI